MILMYHNIAEQNGPNTVSLDNFTRQMEYIKKSDKYNILKLEDYINNLFDKQIINPISISFDDAYVSLTEHVLPVIKRLNIPVSVFVPTAFPGKHNVWDIEKGYPKLRFYHGVIFII